MLPINQLADDFRQTGLRAGDIVIVHSSYKSLGPIAGGPAGVVAALQQVIAPAGTILMPTFADPQLDGLFDVRQTPSRVGAISEAFRTSPGVGRSFHPTHAVSAWGDRAAAFLAGHEQASGLGVDSPLHRAAIAGATVLMIGCDLRSCSVVHVAESIAALPYLGKVCYPGYDRTLTTLTPTGQRLTIAANNPPTCSANFGVIEPALEAKDQLRRVRIGQADTLLFRAADAIDAALSALQTDPAALLCASSRCAVCPTARTLVEAM